MAANAEPMLLFTFIRHGESTDNLRPVWAGWADAPLSDHGMNQAKALGASLTSTPFTAIYASDLKRAASTAAAVSAAQPSSTPAVQHSTLVREQHFGIAEGHPWSADTPSGSETDEELWARGIFPVLSDRRAKFPSGESLDDVRARTDRAVEELLMPHMCRAAREGKRGVHVAVVSHGLCISELVPALLARGVGAPKGQRYSGLRNTAWTRVAVDVKGVQEGEGIEFPNDDPPLFQMRVTDVNRHEHLSNVTYHSQKGDAVHDPKQKKLRDFFGGGGNDVSAGAKVEVLDHAESNVEDHPVAKH